MNKEISPDLEQDYLSFNAYLSLLMSIIILLVSAGSFFDEYLRTHIEFSWALKGLTIMGVLPLIFILAKGQRFFRFSFSKTAWLGIYEDEYLNQVNLLAYKSTFLTLLSIFVIGYFGVFDEVVFSFQEICGFFASISLAVYGAMVCIKLRADDE